MSIGRDFFFQMQTRPGGGRKLGHLLHDDKGGGGVTNRQKFADVLNGNGYPLNDPNELNCLTLGSTKYLKPFDDFGILIDDTVSAYK